MSSQRRPAVLGSSEVALSEAYDLGILDLDGVVYVGDQAVDGAATSVAAAIKAGMRCCYLTNNASRPASGRVFVWSHSRTQARMWVTLGSVIRYRMNGPSRRAATCSSPPSPTTAPPAAADSLLPATRPPTCTPSSAPTFASSPASARCTSRPPAANRHSPTASVGLSPMPSLAPRHNTRCSSQRIDCSLATLALLPSAAAELKRWAAAGPWSGR